VDRAEREESRRQREREQDPDYWDRVIARSEAEERDVERTKAAGRAILRVLFAQLKFDLNAIEAERAKRIQRGETGGLLTRLFGSPLPDKDVLTVSKGNAVINLGHLYHYKFDTAFERFSALSFLNILNPNTRSPHIDKAIAHLKEQDTEEEQSDSWREGIQRRGGAIEKAIGHLEEPLQAAAKAAVAAYERSRDSCNERNPSCTGWNVSDCGWAVSSSRGWHWTGTHILTICGDRHVFGTPYEYLAVFKARSARSAAKNEEDVWGNAEMKAFQNDHEAWCASQMPRLGRLA
jgi:hypothetical protein